LFIVERSTDYMAFGLSGEADRLAMPGADVIVVDHQNDEARAIDYSISGAGGIDIFAYAQVR